MAYIFVPCGNIVGMGPARGAMVPSIVPFKREKSANLRNYVRQIRRKNLTVRKKVRRFLVTISVC